MQNQAHVKSIIERVVKKKQAQAQYQWQYFGAVEELKCIDFGGKRLVVNKNSFLELHPINGRPQDPPDFFINFLAEKLDRNWIDQQTSHPLITWYQEARPNINEEKKELFWHQPNEAGLSLLHFAYDFYLAYLAGCITPRLIERLKRQVEFNGARYEVFVFSILIRAGFEVTLCDEASGVPQLESDPENSKSVECIAKHSKSGEEIFVEAKVRNTKGLLGANEGQKEIKNFVYRNQLKRAIAKPFNKPYVIFVDLNTIGLETKLENKVITDARKEVHKLIDLHKENLPTAIIFTNYPFLIGKQENPMSGRYLLHGAKFPFIEGSQIISDLEYALSVHKYVPKEFNEAEKYVESLKI